MIRCDGQYNIFLIQHLQKDKKWVQSILDVFGYPEHFNASGECWQKTGVHGTFNWEVALAGLIWIRKRNLGNEFRLAVVRIDQTTTPIDGI